MMIEGRRERIQKGNCSVKLRDTASQGREKRIGQKKWGRENGKLRNAPLNGEGKKV